LKHRARKDSVLEFATVLSEDAPVNPPKSPYEFFDACFAKAKSLKLPLAESMVLVTATPEGKPSGRVVLLKDVVRDGGFRFYTNYESRKSIELFANPQAQLLFYWQPFGRQIRIEGNVRKVSDAESG